MNEKTSSRNRAARSSGPSPGRKPSRETSAASAPPRGNDGELHDKLTRGDRLTVAVDPAAGGGRLDKVLAELVAPHRPELSRSRIRSLIEAEHVTVTESGRSGATITDPSYRVKPGQSFAIVVPEPASARPTAQSLPLTIVYEDAELLVVDKPAGLVVHPAAGNPDMTLVNALLAHCGDSLSGIGGVRRPGIVHRLDKDTSGLMVVAKTDTAHAALAEQFASHSLDRAYQAVVWGVPEPAQGEISGNLGRDSRHRRRMTVMARGGKSALTRYKVMRRLGRSPAEGGRAVASLVECRLATGRTHQIRVHMAWIGHPLLGESTYKAVRRGLRQPPRPPAAAAASAALGRQALHAYRIGFRHPTSGETLAFESSLPIDIKELISNLEAL